jgi:hypothetical protein
MSMYIRISIYTSFYLSSIYLSLFSCFSLSLLNTLSFLEVNLWQYVDHIKYLSKYSMKEQIYIKGRLDYLKILIS